MAENDDFSIKGAAQELSPPEGSSQDQHGRPVEEVQSKDNAEEGERERKESSTQNLLAKHRWYKCVADPAVYGSDQWYYVHADSGESRWDEPEEPYWLYDQDAGAANTAAGLQHPKQAKPVRAEALGLNKRETYTGYIPSIHGDYDPNADYAQYHHQKRAEEQAATDPLAMSAVGAGAYESTMALNRFTGSVQASGLNPERHTDAAKSGRQMNAFFDVDAAANSHDGRSLKEERKHQKLTKEEIKQFNQQRKEKKQKKRMAFYKS